MMQCMKKFVLLRTFLKTWYKRSIIFIFGVLEYQKIAISLLFCGWEVFFIYLFIFFTKYSKFQNIINVFSQYLCGNFEGLPSISSLTIFSTDFTPITVKGNRKHPTVTIISQTRAHKENTRTFPIVFVLEKWKALKYRSPYYRVLDPSVN